MTERLRALALERLGPYAPALAREALEAGEVEVVEDVLGWQGSLGQVRAHRVVVATEPGLAARVASSPFAIDALTAAFAAAIVGTGASLAELVVTPRPIRATKGPYRG